MPMKMTMFHRTQTYICASGIESDISGQSDKNHNPGGSWKRFQARVKGLNTLIMQMESWTDSSKEINDLSLKLLQNEAFPVIKRNLLMSRLFTYETGLKPFLRFAFEPLVAFVPDQATECKYFDDSCLNTAVVRRLQNISSEMVLRMITAMSGDIPLCKEEVWAISHNLHSKFKSVFDCLESCSLARPEASTKEGLALR